MKIIKLSTILLLLGGLGYAGGDISPVTDYEIEDVVVADEESSYIEPIVEEQPVVAPIVEEEPVYIAPKQPQEPVIVPKPRKKISTNGFYAGLGITGVRYKNNCNCKSGIKKEYKDNTAGIVARVGYDFNQYIGIEARGSKTNWDSDGSKVEHSGVYLKPMLPIGKSSNVYGLIGAAKTKVKGTVPHVDSEGLAVGGGVEIDLSKDTPKDGRYSRDFDGHGDQEKGVGLFIDYERMVAEKDAPIVDGVSAGITYDF
ncbi:MAG: outer membrane beta-barrel protein [Epsilonproteobacteria bacterium]|nr:outer membrane beta-barrel protein [Campylobacterota bacterium]